MAVKFRCPCGAILHADELHIDSIKPCPHCHVNLRIPPAPGDKQNCVACKHPIPRAHTIWVRGRRVCWKCMPPGALRLDMNAFQEHRKHQLDAIRKAKTQGLHHFQYHAPFEAAHNEVQVTADEVVLHESDWHRITPAWAELGLMPFDLGTFMGVGLNSERISEQAEDSKKYVQPLLAFVKLADELPMASIPKDPGSPGASAMIIGPTTKT